MKKTMVIREFTCPLCGKTHFVQFDYEEFKKWERGKSAQEAFRSLTSTEREQIISHICPSCQVDIFEEDLFEEEEELF